MTSIRQPDLWVRTAPTADDHSRLPIFVHERKIGREFIVFGKGETHDRCTLIAEHKVKVAIGGGSHLDVPVFPGGREA
jgi:hypothetical protein